MRDIFQVLVEKITVKTVFEEGIKVQQVTIVYRFDKPAAISEYNTHAIAPIYGVSVTPRNIIRELSMDRMSGLFYIKTLSLRQYS